MNASDEAGTEFSPLGAAFTEFLPPRQILNTQIFSYLSPTPPKLSTTYPRTYPPLLLLLLLPARLTTEASRIPASLSLIARLACQADSSAHLIPCHNTPIVVKKVYGQAMDRFITQRPRMSPAGKPFLPISPPSGFNAEILLPVLAPCGGNPLSLECIILTPSDSATELGPGARITLSHCDLFEPTVSNPVPVIGRCGLRADGPAPVPAQVSLV